MKCDAAAIMLPDTEGKELRVHALDFPDSRGFFKEAIRIPMEGSMPGKTFQTGKPLVITRLDHSTRPAEMDTKAAGEGVNSFCDLPLFSRDRMLGILVMARGAKRTRSTAMKWPFCFRS